MLRDYYYLTKPGIIKGNLMVAVAGFLLAARGDIDWWQLLAMAAGLALVIGSACAFNNYLDRNLDKKMQRTQKRALVSGSISGRQALIFASLLAIGGFSILAHGTNWLTTAAAATGFVAYVAVYGVAKRLTSFGTEWGSISGAIPPVVGYTAVTGQLDAAAASLFFILVFWQMPHFYAIATFRLKDYRAAELPVLPAVKGIRTTKIRMAGYIIAFIIASLSLTVLGYTGYVYASVMLALGLLWLWKALQGLHTSDNARWARGVFGYSLIVLTTLSILLSIDILLP